MVQKVLQLKCNCNEYPWGKQGSKSLAAQLCSKTPGTDFKIDEEKSYSEMWFGTYPDLPSYVLENGEDLQKVVDNNSKELIGEQLMEKFGHTNLPYLPKVLSIAKALPLQLHPNKDLASKLHEKDPSQFTDPNHKPEIALALGPFEAFCGFKPLSTIASLLELPPFQRFKPKTSDFDKAALKELVRSMLKADPKTIKEVNAELQKLPKEKFGSETHIPDLVPRLAEQYDGGDNGIIVALITMNYMKLNAGDSIYIPADGIHAYLSGDIIECMARSNNVLNTGFCPSADRNNIDTFCDVLTFEPMGAEQCLLKDKSFGRSKEGKTKVYAPPLSEFDVLATELGKGESDLLGPLQGPSTLVVTKGSGKMKADGKEYDLKEGYTYFVGQGTAMEFVSEEGLKVFTAFAE